MNQLQWFNTGKLVALLFSNGAMLINLEPIDNGAILTVLDMRDKTRYEVTITNVSVEQK